MESIIEEARSDEYVGNYISTSGNLQPILDNDNKVVGFIDSAIYQTELKIYLLYIAKEHRKKRYAHDFLKLLMNTYNEIVFYTRVDNLPMRHLAIKLGFYHITSNYDLEQYHYRRYPWDYSTDWIPTDPSIGQQEHYRHYVENSDTRLIRKVYTSHSNIPETTINSIDMIEKYK